MKFTLKWLKSFLDTNHSAIEIADRLNSIGFEVEGIIDRSSEIAPFQVAEIISAEKHPSADKLRVCRVLTKDGEKQIVCGAPNARAGIKVVLAPIGTIIPNGKFTIKEAEIRGIKSVGMMCSLDELLIFGNSDGIIELPLDAKIGDNVAQYFGLDDPVIEISVTPNRGDALGVYGIARDLAAAGAGKLIPVDISSNGEIKASACKNSEAVVKYSPLFILREISGLKNIESPLWLKHYLQNIGVGSISAIVDITNYICHGFGRPMHAYDKTKLSGNLKVTKAEDGEKFKSLSDKEYTLSAEDIVIRDDKSVQALAGIIGGMDSACDDNTVSIVLESALFDKDSITKTGRRLGIDTDSRYRFERHTDPMMVIPAMEVATKMILEICGGKSSAMQVFGLDPVSINQHEYITITSNDIERALGVKIDLILVQNILENLGFKVEFSSNQIKALAPSWRYDISIKEDLIEEIVRIYGFENIPSIEIPGTVNFRLMKQSLSRSILAKRVMAASGFDELVTFSFMKSKDAGNFAINQDALTLQNPISSELDYMRPSIIPNLLDAIVKNHARSIYDLAFFEVGPIFEGAGREDEQLVCSAVISGNVDSNIHTGFREADLFDMKAAFGKLLSELGFECGRMQMITENLPSYLHPTRSSMVMLGKNCLGWFGEIHPLLLQKYDIAKRVVAFEMKLSAIPETRLKYGRREEFVISSFQSVTRDFAFVMSKDVAVGQVVTCIEGVDKKLIRNVDIFDIYMGDKIAADKKSVALKVTIQADDRTLGEDELGNIQNSIIENVTKKFCCVLR